MGFIHEDVRKAHLAAFPEEESLLKPFLDGFEITWGRRRQAFNTELSVFFLKPDKHLVEMFGFNQEIMLAYSPFPTLEPRALQAIEKFLEDDPARGRVEKLTVLIATDAKNPEEWIRNYVASNQESRVIVAFNSNEIRANQGDAWFVRNKIAGQLFSRDLFDFRLPLERDTYFFGREDLLLDYRDAARRGENRGLFGLRKTGKTSFLFKLRRFMAEDNTFVLYYDSKSPSIRQLHWYELLEKIAQDIAKAIGTKFKPPSDHRRYAEKFSELLNRVPHSHRILIIFDEIEYISPFSIDDIHWAKEYLPFWQTIWAAQSEHRRLSVLIAGVNPSIVEVDRIDGVQNPLFGIVPYSYLKGLGEDEVRRLLRVLGKRMGVNFDDDAVRYVHNRYGGHPLLTRIAASITHRRLVSSSVQRPFNITTKFLKENEASRDAELTFYCRHVVSELRDFYPDEYQLLEWLSAGRTADYIEFSNYPEYVRHLREYGLITDNENGAPTVKLEVVAKYIALEEARREGRRTILRLIPVAERKTWLKRRVTAIIEDFAELQRLIRANSLVSLFGPNSFPESHRFAMIPVVTNETEFESFINCCNRCFVESIENYGQHQLKKQYFWDDIKTNYPTLHNSLHRIKIYRHQRMHIKLEPGVELALQKYIAQDLEDREPRNVDDLWFVLEQATLDALLNSLQVEISRLSR